MIGIIVAILIVALFAWLIHAFVTAPYGVEIPYVGFVETDKDGKPR